MITGEPLAAVLHALSTGFADRALNIVVMSEEIEDPALRSALSSAITSNEDPTDQARALGEALRDVNADQPLVNECYRAAFYLGGHAVKLAENPLYAQFIANRAGPVLDKWPHYFPIYTRHLERFRGRSVKVLEIGVYRGGGLDLLSRYLGPDADLVGLDVDEAAVRAARGRYPVVLGDQADPDTLRALDAEHGPFDIVIDDGGHTMRQQIVSIETLFPLLVDGGVYLVEDCHTSYWPAFGGELAEPGSFIEWSKRRVDDMNSRHHRGIDRTSVWANDLDGLHAYDSVVVFEKQRRYRSFNEVVGSSSYLFAARFSESIGVELLATRDEALRQRDALRQEVDQLTLQQPDSAGPRQPTEPERVSEELRLARAELRRSRAQLAGLGAELQSQTAELDSMRNQLLESWEQLKSMRSTVSWRTTAPLRVIRRLGS